MAQESEHAVPAGQKAKPRAGRLRRIGLVLLGVLVLLQLVPLGRDNPPVTLDVGAPPQIAALMRRACYDCHSNEVRWPWYAYVAPVSFLVARDVKAGRKHMNYSEWDKLDPDRQRRKLRKSAKLLEEGEMPMPIYLPLHPEAKLTEPERNALLAWLRGAAGGGGGGGGRRDEGGW